MKYANVECSDKFYPFLGDIKVMLNRIAKNEYVFQDFIESAIERPEKDIKVHQLGSLANFYILSIRARDEFERLISNKVDRYPSKEFPLSYPMTGSIIFLESTEDWRDRRTSLMKLIGLNSVSKHAPMMIQTTDEIMNK